MSLSSYQAHNIPMGGVGGGMQPINTTSIPNQSTSQPIANNNANTISSILGGDGSNNDSSRGELTGDPCFTIDLYSINGMMTAIWSEETASCSLLVNNNDSLEMNKELKPVISYTSKGKELLNTTTFSKDISSDNRNEHIMIGQQPSTTNNITNNINDTTIIGKYEPLFDLFHLSDVSNDESQYLLVKHQLSLLIDYHINLYNNKKKNKQDQTISKTNKKNKKNKKTKTNITLVLPG